MEKPNLKSVKDKDVIAYIEYLEKMLEKFSNSPYADSYISTKKILDDWNKQLSEHRIDIFNADDAKKFSMVKTFLKEQKFYTEQIEYYKSKMTASEVKSADDRILAEGAIAEKYIFKDK
jgi:hypothetical protein